jgi:RHS repeat-associated protein
VRARTLGASSTVCTHDGNGTMVQRETVGASGTESTVYIGGIYERRDDGTITKYYAALGRMIAMREVPPGGGDGELRYLLADHLGGTTVVTDDTGAVLAQRAYWPYGGERTIQGDQRLTARQYTGQREEDYDGLGLYNYKARFYSTTLGRFVSADPISADGLNHYSYVANNPLRYIDPSGYCIVWAGEELDCDEDKWLRSLSCGVGGIGCTSDVGRLFRAGIQQASFWNLGARYNSHSGGIFAGSALNAVIEADYRWGMRALDRIPAYGWGVLAGMFGIRSGRYFRASITGLLYGSSTVQGLALADIVGATEWWDDVRLMIWKADWHRRFGAPWDLSRTESASKGWWEMTVRAGFGLSDVNNRPWSDPQLTLLSLSGINVDEALARHWRNELYSKSIECIASVMTRCAFAISWPADTFQ